MKRSYRQNCALAHALDAVGDRWTLLIVRELLLGPRRYGEILENLNGIGTNLLADRLKALEAVGLIEKTAQRYRLTATGHRLEPVVWELIRFGLGLGVADRPERLTRPEWDAVALRALYRPDRDAGLEGCYAVELDRVPFCIERVGQELRVTLGECEQPRVRISLGKSTARRLAAGELSVEAGIGEGVVRVSGSRREAKRLLAAFGLAG